MKYYYMVQLNIANITSEKLKEIEQEAYDKFVCSGIQEFSIDEEEVDKILGDRAYSGGDISDKDISHIENSVGNKERIIIKLFFTDEKCEFLANGFFNWLKESFPNINSEINREENKDWNVEWRKNYAPIIVSPNLTIVPEWMRDDYKDRDDAIFIYPGQGFGTGTHETTYLCLKFLDELSSCGEAFERCLDFGCGSGILGISSLGIRPMQVDFCDIDLNALENCQQNLDLNFDESFFKDKVKLFLRDKFTCTTEYDLVYANILENVLFLEGDLLIKSLKKGGKLILSGILVEQEKNVLNFFNEDKNLKLISIKESGHWKAILFEKMS